MKNRQKNDEKLHADDRNAVKINIGPVKRAHHG